MKIQRIHPVALAAITLALSPLTACDAPPLAERDGVVVSIGDPSAGEDSSGDDSTGDDGGSDETGDTESPVDVCEEQSDGGSPEPVPVGDAKTVCRCRCEALPKTSELWVYTSKAACENDDKDWDFAIPSPGTGDVTACNNRNGTRCASKGGWTRNLLGQCNFNHFSAELRWCALESEPCD
jgi:hypothetical protein